MLSGLLRLIFPPTKTVEKKKTESEKESGTTTAKTLSLLESPKNDANISITELTQHTPHLSTSSSSSATGNRPKVIPVMSNQNEKIAELQERIIDGQKVMTCQLLRYGMQMQLLCSSPPLVWIENFISAAEAEKIIALAKPRMTRSGEDFAKPGSLKEETITSERRTSSSAAFHRNENELIAAVEKRLMYLAGTTIYHIEHLQVTAYKPGQTYLAHYDTKATDAQLIDDGGLRTHTFLVYLTDAPFQAGGATCFPKLGPNGLRVQPKQGCVLWWPNVIGSKMATGEQCLEVDFRTLHSGEMLKSGEKYIINAWIRHTPFVLNHIKHPPSKVIIGQSPMEKIAAALAAYPIQPKTNPALGQIPDMQRPLKDESENHATSSASSLPAKRGLLI